MVTLENRLDNLEDLTLIHNGAERTGYEALAAGHTLILIDHSSAMLIGNDGIHTAGYLTRPLHMDNGMVGAGFFAFSAFNASACDDICHVFAAFHNFTN